MTSGIPPSNAGVVAGTVGVVAGMVAMQAAQEEEEAKHRRKSHMGHDQILIKSKLPVDKMGECIAGTFNNWRWEDGDIMRDPRNKKSPSKLTTHFAAYAAIIYGIVIAVQNGIRYYTSTQYYNPWSLDLMPNGISIICLIVMLGILSWSNVTDNASRTLDYIRISKIPGGSKVLLKIYDDDGERNLDEDELDEIITQIKEEDKTAMVV